MKKSSSKSEKNLVAFSKVETGLKEKDRAAVAEGLGRVLADSYQLLVKTHNYHWNVRGPLFNTVHLMTEAQYLELFTAVDIIAERIRSLGYLAPGSFAEFSSLSPMAEGTNTLKATKMIKDLVESNEQIVRNIRAAIPHAENAKDDATADLLTGRLNIHEKNAWMLRSLIEE